MFTLLIVDDEASARRGLSNCVDWHSIGVEVCGHAMNGLQAIDMINNLSPDIVLSDVRMPFMDGIELCQNLKESQNKAKIILVSGYDDVDYLKSAINLGVEDYIFKPVSVQELNKVVCNTIKKIKEEQKTARMHFNMKQKLEESMPLLREHFFINLIMKDEKMSNSELKSKLDYLDIPLPVDSPYELLLVKIYCDRLNEYDKHVLAIELPGYIRNYLADKEIVGQVLQTASDEFSIILPISLNQGSFCDACFSMADDLVKNINEMSSVDLNISIGKEANGLADISESYIVAKEALLSVYFKGKNTVLVSNAQAYTKNDALFWKDERELTGALKTGNSGHIDVLLSELYDIILRKNIDIDSVHALYRRILTVAITVLHDNGLFSGKITEDAVLLMSEIGRIPTLDAYHQEIKSYLLTVSSVINKSRESNNGVIIKQIKELINSRLSENLTIKDIANAIKYSPSYISSVFRNETGQTINDYITECRMKKAQQLLKDPALKIYTVAEMVGYSDTKYFSRLFKNYVGVYPSEYRS